MEVHKEKGSGFAEPVYQECLEKELGFQSIPFVREQELRISYKGEELKTRYKADFVCYGEVIIETKVVENLIDKHTAQVLNYLKATGLKRALLFNFQSDRLEYKRIVLDY